MIDPVEKAAKKSGGIVALALRLGIKHQSLYGWRRVPAEHCLVVEELSGISRHELRPDVYGPAPSKAAAE